ncbi:hypothetical protein TeGR_g14324, partial [Tetraparma gracilis]
EWQMDEDPSPPSTSKSRRRESIYKGQSPVLEIDGAVLDGVPVPAVPEGADHLAALASYVRRLLSSLPMSDQLRVFSHNMNSQRETDTAPCFTLPPPLLPTSSPPSLFLDLLDKIAPHVPRAFLDEMLSDVTSEVVAATPPPPPPHDTDAHAELAERLLAAAVDLVYRTASPSDRGHDPLVLGLAELHGKVEAEARASFEEWDRSLPAVVLSRLEMDAAEGEEGEDSMDVEDSEELKQVMLEEDIKECAADVRQLELELDAARSELEVAAAE